jgi:hemerythrin-like domain-containing protein
MPCSLNFLSLKMTQQTIRIIRDEHNVLRALLNSLRLMLERGPSSEPERFFDVLRAMLFYIDEFPELRHHPKESNVLFPRLAKLAPETVQVIALLDLEHKKSESLVHELQHQLLEWELLGESRRSKFEQTVADYCEFYMHHMRQEEEVILPAAQQIFTELDWEDVDEAFASNCDPLTGQYPANLLYEQLYNRIAGQVTRLVMKAVDASDY